MAVHRFVGKKDLYGGHHDDQAERRKRKRGYARLHVQAALKHDLLQRFHEGLRRMWASRKESRDLRGSADTSVGLADWAEVAEFVSKSVTIPLGAEVVDFSKPFKEKPPLPEVESADAESTSSSSSCGDGKDLRGEGQDLGFLAHLGG